MCGLGKSLRGSSLGLGTAKLVIQFKGSLEVTFPAVVTAVASTVQGLRRQQLRWRPQNIWAVALLSGLLPGSFPGSDFDFHAGRPARLTSLFPARWNESCSLSSISFFPRSSLKKLPSLIFLGGVPRPQLQGAALAQSVHGIPLMGTNSRWASHTEGRVYMAWVGEGFLFLLSSLLYVDKRTRRLDCHCSDLVTRRPPSKG